MYILARNLILIRNVFVNTFISISQLLFLHVWASVPRPFIFNRTVSSPRLYSYLKFCVHLFNFVSEPLISYTWWISLYMNVFRGSLVRSCCDLYIKDSDKTWQQTIACDYVYLWSKSWSLGLCEYRKQMNNYFNISVYSCT